MSYCLFGEVNRIDMECNTILHEKNLSYGDSYKEYSYIGILIRINDKINRLKQLEKNSIKIMCNESVRDSLLDLRNYATLALIEMDNAEKD